MTKPSSYPLWICRDKGNDNDYCYIYQMTNNLYMIEYIYDVGVWATSYVKKFMTYKEIEKHLHNRLEMLYYNVEQTDVKIQQFKDKYLYPKEDNEDPSSDESEDPKSE